jgi:hypothetical protein
MEEKVFFLLLAVILFVVLGPFKLSDLRVRGGDRYRPENYRFTTPGRIQRQRELAQDRNRDRRGEQAGPSQDEGEKEDPEVEDSGDKEGEAIEHPELAAKIKEDVCIFFTCHVQLSH